MNNRIEKLITLIGANKTQTNVANLSGILIDRESTTNEASGNSSPSSTINVRPLLMTESKRFKFDSSIRKHKCERCKIRFQTSTQLTVHKRIHLKEKPFSCDQCQMNFMRKGDLDRHKRIH